MGFPVHLWDRVALPPVSDKVLNSVSPALPWHVFSKSVEEAGKLYSASLTHAGVPLSQRQLDDACEAHLQQRFGEKLDFAVENSLPFLIHDGLIRETGDVRLSPARALACSAKHI